MLQQIKVRNVNGCLHLGSLDVPQGRRSFFLVQRVATILGATGGDGGPRRAFLLRTKAQPAQPGPNGLLPLRASRHGTQRMNLPLQQGQDAGTVRPEGPSFTGAPVQHGPQSTHQLLQVIRTLGRPVACVQRCRLHILEEGQQGIPRRMGEVTDGTKVRDEEDESLVDTQRVVRRQLLCLRTVLRMLCKLIHGTLYLHVTDATGEGLDLLVQLIGDGRQ